MASTAGLTRGDRAPDMVLPSADGTPTRFYAHAGGRPALLLLVDETCGPGLQSLANALGGVSDDELTVHVVGPPSLALAGLPFALLQDVDGRAAAAYRTSGVPTAFLLDRNLRVRTSMPFVDGDAVARATLEVQHELAWDRSATREIATLAPLLVVPDVLSPHQCATLVEVWEKEGHRETGVEASTSGRRAEQISTAMKRRTDHIVTEPQRSREIAAVVGRRVMPEIARAFAYRATRFEGFKIVCYEAAERGFFAAHRDNLSPSTAHRRFALTLNLSDEYEGGQLRFPEYGSDLYRPPAGAALLFSCSLLHEVRHVTAGRRFVLLSFLFGDDPTQPAPGAATGVQQPN
jgi:predicted 2-oxoglutarate/Fe(II)-dependent dioxygenase YbiX